MRPHRIAVLSGALALLAASCAQAPRSPEPARRVFLIGIDGATWDRIEPLLEAGRMATLAELMREGASAPLHSLLPTVSPALWTTVATGKDFEEHGINDFTVTVDDEDGTKNARVMHMTSNMRRTKALWNILGDVGKRSAFVGWWVTWPAEPVAGYMVSSHIPLDQTGGRASPTKGTITPDLSGQTWPPELFDEVRPLIRTPDTVTFEEARRFMTLREEELDRDIVEGFRWAYAADETYRAVVRLLLEKEPDLPLWGLYFNGVDVVEHRYWKYNEPEFYRPFDRVEIPRFRNVIDRYYTYTDGILGEILAQARPGDTFLVLSDHGFHARGHKDAPPGVFVAWGHNIRANVVVDPPQLADITPTVLALLGLPAGEDMSGRVLEEIFTPEWQAAYPRERIPTYDTPGWREEGQVPVASEVDQELMERLHALGYLE